MSDIENTEKLTYRVLNKNENERYELYRFGGLDAPIINRERSIRLLGQKQFGDITKTVNSHIVSGNEYESNWISTSKDLINTLMKYAYDKIEFNHNEYRPYLAIIKNCASSFLEIKMGNDRKPERFFLDDSIKLIVGKTFNDPYDMPSTIMKADLDIFSNIVYDCSTREKYIALQELGFIRNKDGSRCKSSNQTSPNYAENDSEVLVHGKINNSAVMFGSPLYADLLYIYSRYNTSFLVIRSIYSIIKNFEDVKGYANYMPLLKGLTNEELILYRSHYETRLPLSYIAEKIADYDIDYYIELKESILRKICYNLEQKFTTLKKIPKPRFYSFEKENKEYVVDEVKRLILKK